MRPLPEDWRERAPRITERAWSGLARVLEHPDAPKYNRTIGDRVGDAELQALDAFRSDIERSGLEADLDPSPRITDWVESHRDRLFLLHDLPQGFDVAKDFTLLPTTDRDAIARRLEELVPRDLALDEAIVYSTSATTGHAVIIPSHPRAMVQNLAHIERVAGLHGVTLAPTEGEPFAMNASCQRQTYVFATSMSGWQGAVFTKINVAPHDWAGGEASRGRFLADFAPSFLASDPSTLSEALRLELPLRPKLVVSSAVGLAEEVGARVRDAWSTQIVDLYSMTETGPIAATVPGVRGHVVLLPDVFVEALDPAGRRVPDGARGEITVTGGRNPFLPLIRYRTGDHGALETVTLSDGTRARVIRDLEGRAPITFRATDGGPVGSVDIARRIRPIAPFVQHALHQRADASIELRLRPLPGVPLPLGDFERALRGLFGSDAEVQVVVDPALGVQSAKVIAWRSDLGDPVD